MVDINFDGERCKSCGLCVSVCPKQIIKISKNKMNSKGYNPAQITEKEKCIGCASCAMICPDCVITIGKDK